MKLPIIIILSFLSFSCSLNTQQSYPEFNKTKKELFEAKQKLKNSQDAIVFLIIINEKGRVVRSRLVDWNNDRVSKDKALEFKKQLNHRVFAPAEEGDPEFRQLFEYMYVESNFSFR